MSRASDVLRRCIDAWRPRMRTNHRSEHARAGGRSRVDASPAVRRGLCCLLVVVGVIGCAPLPPGPPAPASGPPRIDRLFIFVRDWPTYDVELQLVRRAGKSTVTLFRQARNGRPRIVLDTIGPRATDVDEIRAMLDSFDVWALNAPNAPGAACSTVKRQRSCRATHDDYSIVMRVEAGREVRVQRYTNLKASTSNETARALGDFVLAWAWKRDPRVRRQ